MKNLTKIIVCIIIGAFLFSACQKEGQYLPKKKIAKIEHITTSSMWGITTTAVSDYQEWEWTGKLLSKITLRDGDGDIDGVIVPQYDKKKRVSSLHCVSGSDIDDYNFKYEGKNLMKITHTSSDKDVAVYTFVKEDKNVVEITVTGYSKSNDMAGVNPLQLVLPDVVADVIKPSDEKATAVYKLVWNGGNLVSMEQFVNGVLNMNYNWTYDNAINPLKGLFCNGYGSMNGFEELYSANNVVESHIVPQFSILVGEQHVKYSYEYEDDYPVKKTWESTSSTGLEVVHTYNYMYN
ncbi:MAG: hypothetical protein K5890_06050 [Bacteroidales bacterium]|nr:hypothetical protein [Bacteroidales bacterium]